MKKASTTESTGLIGTLVGGLLVIPFYKLYTSQPFGIPDWIWLVSGLCLVIWCNFVLGADSAIQPGSVIYFVVIYTVGTERVLPYTIARILDTGGGVLIALLLYVLFPSKHDREKGVSLLTFWAETKYAFKSYINKNRTSRKKERENFGAEDENFSTIISKIKDNCEYKVDALGSIIAFKKGKKRTNKKVMICAHMDEVGFIITDITDDGYLKFAPVGGIDARIVADRKVTINNINGVIGLKPIHLLSSDEKEKAVSFKNLFIDIGAKDKSDAEKFVSLGDFAYFSSNYYEFGEGFIKTKALDDRIGCMLMIELINSDLEYDTYFCFNVQEEVGLRGSKCTSFDIQPDISVILESTTAADLCGVTGGDRVCVLGDGPVISFMDGRTVYDKTLYNLARKTADDNNIPAQTKTAIAGGNDAGSIQTSGKGSKVIAISLPSRYIHSSSSVVKSDDIENTKLLNKLLPKLYD